MLIATLSAELKEKMKGERKKKRGEVLCPARAMGFIFNLLLQIAFFVQNYIMSYVSHLQHGTESFVSGQIAFSRTSSQHDTSAFNSCNL